jgi:hypothetical protein
MTLDSIVISSRFHGPPKSGNGGYVCGVLGARINGPARVRLQVPPPLEKPLAIRHEADELLLVDGDTLVARAKPSPVDFEPPRAPSVALAEEASKHFAGFTSHVFPTCFVCGPRRDPGDGLRIFPGRIGGTDWVACPWIPDESLAGAGGDVASEFLWAALDCPGAFSFGSGPLVPVLLGELTVDIKGGVTPGERCVVVAKEIDHEGRKHRTVTLLYGKTGDCRAIGLATWIEVPSE